jgi:hypothetical protein
MKTLAILAMTVAMWINSPEYVPTPERPSIVKIEFDSADDDGTVYGWCFDGEAYYPFEADSEDYISAGLKACEEG